MEKVEEYRFKNLLKLLGIQEQFMPHNLDLKKCGCPNHAVEGLLGAILERITKLEIMYIGAMNEIENLKGLKSYTVKKEQ